MVLAYCTKECCGPAGTQAQRSVAMHKSSQDLPGPRCYPSCRRADCKRRVWSLLHASRNRINDPNAAQLLSRQLYTSRSVSINQSVDACEVSKDDIAVETKHKSIRAMPQRLRNQSHPFRNASDALRLTVHDRNEPGKRRTLARLALY